MAAHIAFGENDMISDLVPFSQPTVTGEPYPNCGAFRPRKLQQPGSVLHFDMCIS